MDLIELTDIAIKAARSAGQIIQQHMNEDVLVEKKAGVSSAAAQVVTAVDIACEKTILPICFPLVKRLTWPSSPKRRRMMAAASKRIISGVLIPWMARYLLSRNDRVFQ